MGKVITMFALKKEESPIQGMLDEMGKKLSIKMMAENERLKLIAAKAKRAKQS